MSRPPGLYLSIFLALVMAFAAHAQAQSRVWQNGSSHLNTDRKSPAQPADHYIFSDWHQRATEDRVIAAIHEASAATGVDFQYLIAKAEIESRLDPDAEASSSSATGLFQFIEGTWLRGLELYGDEYGFAYRFGDELENEKSSLALRRDPKASALLAAAYTRDHALLLSSVLGRDASHTELYLAHFLGSGGASKFLRSWRDNPELTAAPLFLRAARANSSIFYASSGKARSLDEVLNLINVKLSKAGQSAFNGLGAARLEQTPSGLFIEQYQNDLDGFRESFSSWLEWPERSIPMLEEHPNSAIFLDIYDCPLSTLRVSSLSTRSAGSAPETFPQATNAAPPRSEHSDKTCNHTEMCYPHQMSTSTITRVRDLIASGEFTKAGIARAAGLHANTLRDANEPDWNPTADTLTKLQSFIDSNDDIPVLVGIEEIIDEARNGRMYILVDDEDRENEGDLIIPAQMATPAAINFMAMHGRGLICLALDKSRVDQLGLDPMSRNNKESMQTAFTVSIEAKEGVTTGISAADRARTVSVAIDATKDADDIVTPGHVFPLMARDGGTLVRAGHTEAAVDISRLAGLNPSGVICEIMNEDGSMARLDDLIEFARTHNLKIGTIRDLIAYRMRNDHLVERVDERAFESDYGGQWRMVTYRDTVANNEAYVLQKGHVVPGEPTLARVHPISVFDDVLGAPGPRKRTLQRAMAAVGEHGSGVIVILTQRVGSSSPWTKDEQDRNIGIGSQILADLGVDDMILLSNSRPDLVALDGYGITITDFMPIAE